MPGLLKGPAGAPDNRAPTRLIWRGRLVRGGADSRTQI